jgi:hypothetical protein
MATKSPTQPQIRNSPTATKAMPSQSANRTARVRRTAGAAPRIAVARYDVTTSPRPAMSGCIQRLIMKGRNSAPFEGVECLMN